MIRKVDDNQKHIVDALRKIPGISVFSTHTIGKGVPDIVVGYCGQNYLFEIKDGAKPPSQQKLTPMEVTFFEKWKGQVCVATCLEDILIELKL
jgi:hypothetical protein